MLWYKAWRESRVRFVAFAGVIAIYCLTLMLRARTEYPIPNLPVSYEGWIWANVYGNLRPGFFAVMALILGLGGLQRERAHGTTGFTLALPASRTRLLVVRFATALAQMAALALMPALLIASLSPWLAHQQYPVSVGLQFGVLFMTWGCIWLALGVVWSIVFAGEYTAALACVLTPFVYTLIYANVSDGGRRYLWANPFVGMSGELLLRPNQGMFVQPLPWATLFSLLSIALVLFWSSVRVSTRQNF